MPLAGTDTILAQLMVTLVQQENILLGLQPAQIQALANGLSKAIIQHFIANAVVAPGILVGTTGGAGATTSPGKLV